MPYLVNKSGAVESVPAEDVAFLQERGWSPAPPEAVAAFERQQAEAALREKFETPGQLLKTGAEGFLRGATFGASDWLETESGIAQPDDVKARAEINPALATATEIGGMVLPAFATGGAGLAGKGAASAVGAASATGTAAKAFQAAKTALSLTPAGLATTAERAVVKAATRELPETAGLLARVTEKAAAEGLGQVPVGVGMGVGKVLHENAVGDPNYTAEALIANPGRVASDVGEAVLFNATLRSLLVGGDKLARVGLSKAGEKLSDERLIRWLDEASGGFSMNATNAPAGQVRKLERTKGGKQGLAQIGNEARDLDIVTGKFGGIADSPDAIRDRAAAVIEEFGAKRKALIEEAQGLIDDDVARAERFAREEAELQGRELTAERTLAAKQAAEDAARQQQKAFGKEAKAFEKQQAATGINEGWLEKLRGRKEEALEALNAAKTNGSEQEIDAARKQYKRVRKALENEEERIAQMKGSAGLAERPVAPGPVEPVSVPPVIVEQVPVKSPGQTTWAEIDSSVRGQIVRGLESEGNTVKVAKAFGELMDDYGVAYGNKNLGLADLTRLKQDIGDFIYKSGRVADPFAKAIADPVKRVYDHIDDLILDGVKAAKGEAGVKALKEYNRALEVAITMKTLAEKGIERGLENNSVHLTGMLGGLAGFSASGFFGAVPGLMATEFVRRRGSAIAGWATGAARDALESRASLLNAMAANNDAIKRGIGTEIRAMLSPEAVKRPVVAAMVKAEESAQDRASSFSERASQIRSAANPEVLLQRAAAITGDWQEHAPKTATAVAATSARAVQFLASKLPTPPAPTTEALISGKSAWQASPGQIEKFDRYYNAALDPRSILKSAAAGRLTFEEIEAVRTIYPNLYRQIQLAALESLQKANGMVPRQVKNSLDLLMGAPPSSGSSLVQATYQRAAASKAMRESNSPPKSKNTKHTESERVTLH